MREDMHKVVTERPRWNERAPHKDRRRRPRGLDVDQLETLPTQVAIGYPGRTKSFTDLLGPLRRFLIGQVGRPWNKVYAELRERISPASTVQIHILGHVETMVARHVNRTFGRTLIGRARRYPRG
jgi:hypothetical protein